LVDIDRARASQFGITASDTGNNISTTFSSSEQVQPNFWTDPKNGIPYYIAVQTPQYLVSSMGDIGNTPVNTGTAPPTAQPVAGGTAKCRYVRTGFGTGQRGQYPAGL
jgi:multidrug efflux pump subunit AcrB